MNTARRIRTIRLIDKLESNQSAAKRLGVSGSISIIEKEKEGRQAPTYQLCDSKSQRGGLL